MTNSQAASHVSWLVRCSPCALRFIQSNQQFQSKNTQIRHFWSQIQAFSFFRKILQLGRFEGADFNYGNTFLENSSLKILEEGIFSSRFGHFDFFTKFDNQKNSRVPISNMTIFFQLVVQEYRNQALLVPNLRIFILHHTVGFDFNDNGFFEFQPENTQMKHYLS